MEKIKGNKVYEITFIDNGVSHLWDGKKICQMIGRDEANEALNGYAPNLVIRDLIERRTRKTKGK